MNGRKAAEPGGRVDARRRHRLQLIRNAVRQWRRQDRHNTELRPIGRCRPEVLGISLALCIGLDGCPLDNDYGGRQKPTTRPTTSQAAVPARARRGAKRPPWGYRSRPLIRRQNHSPVNTPSLLCSAVHLPLEILLIKFAPFYALPNPYRGSHHLIQTHCDRMKDFNTTPP